MTLPDPCGGDVKGGGGCVCDPPFANRPRRIIGDDSARFWSKVDKTGGCWVWRGTVNNGRQPFFGTGHRMHLAHRWLYEQTVGSIPSGIGLVATCRNELCVRPGGGHRVPMTAAERNQAMWDWGRRRQHCSRGHEFTPANTRHRLDGSRACRACQRDRDAARETPHHKRR